MPLSNACESFYCTFWRQWCNVVLQLLITFTGTSHIVPKTQNHLLRYDSVCLAKRGNIDAFIIAMPIFSGTEAHFSRDTTEDGCGFEGWIWVLIASVPEVCILFTFSGRFFSNFRNYVFLCCCYI